MSVNTPMATVVAAPDPPDAAGSASPDSTSSSAGSSPFPTSLADGGEDAFAARLRAAVAPTGTYLHIPEDGKTG